MLKTTDELLFFDKKGVLLMVPSGIKTNNQTSKSLKFLIL
jgi:hypothetical protein